MVHKVLAPIKPTGGAIGVGLLVGFAGAAVCTQFLSLNMPFGGATIFQPAPEFYPVPLGAPLGDCLRSSIAPPTRLSLVTLRGDWVCFQAFEEPVQLEVPSGSTA